MKKNTITTTTATVPILEAIIRLHDKMRGSYFYTPPSSAASRRNYESTHSLTTEFEVNGQAIRVEQTTSCSCRNVYYKMHVYASTPEGLAYTKKDIRYIKGILSFITSGAASSTLVA